MAYTFTWKTKYLVGTIEKYPEIVADKCHKTPFFQGEWKRLQKLV